MMRSSQFFRSVLLMTAVSLVTMTWFAGCATVPDPNLSGFRDREANWGSGYRTANDQDKGSGLHYKGREVERSLGYQ